VTKRGRAGGALVIDMRHTPRGDLMSILAEWGDGTTKLVFHIAILMTGLAFEIMGFRLVASGFRAPQSTVLFQWGENEFRMTQVVPGIAIALIGGGLVIAGFDLIQPRENASDSGEIREADIREVEFTYMSGGSLGGEAWTLTLYGNGHGLLKVEEPAERSVVFLMPKKIHKVIWALILCDVRHLPSDLGRGREHEEMRTIKIRATTFEKTIEIHQEVNESEEHARCVMEVWRSAVGISEEAQKIRETQEPGKSRNAEKRP
jgi:hypothetical protein